MSRVHDVRGEIERKDTQRWMTGGMGDRATAVTIFPVGCEDFGLQKERTSKESLLLRFYYI